MKKGIKINFEEIRKEIVNDEENYELFCYVCDVFSEMQDIANLDGGSVLEQLEYVDNCGSFSCNTAKTVDMLSKIYFSICEFIEEYEKENDFNLSRLYFTNIKAFELYLLYDLYYKYIQKYDEIKEVE